MRSALPVLACLLTGSFFIAPQFVCAAEPVIVFGFAELAAGDGFSAYLEANGSLYAVGNNQHGQLGDGTDIIRFEFSYVTSGVSSLSCGANHLMFIKADGSLWGMGYNSSGQLGDESNASSLLPKQIVPSNVSAAAAGGDHSLFVKTDGSLWAMGANITGQLGDGNTVDSNIPVQVMPSGVVSVSAGGNHSLFVKTDGSLWSMGTGWAGALGTGSDDDNATPTQVVASNVALASAGGNHSLFVKIDGSLWGMGFNSSGQLGDGSTEDKLSPVQILSAGVVSVATGDNHSLILKTDGSLWTMGKNAHGQLGDGSQANRASPVQVESSGIVLLAAGHRHSFYATSTDKLKSMGHNVKGGLGDGSTQDQATPTTVRDGTLTITMSEDGSPTTWSAPSLVATDLDVSDVLTWSLAASPSHGTVVFSGTGASPAIFTYAPDGNYSGSDSFVVQVSDGTSVDAVTVNVNVEAVNDAPAFVQGSSVSVTMSEGGGAVAWSTPTLTFVDAEGDTLNWSSPTEPSNGTSFFEVNGSTVTLNYTPDAEFNGADVFEVSVTDGLESTLLTVNVNVTAVNDAPVIAQGEKVSGILIEEETLAIPDAPTLSASDPDGDSLTWSVVTPPANGSATVSGTGASPTTFTYIPIENFSGEDSFVVMVSDGDLDDTILVTLDVSGVNDAPVIVQGSSVSVTMSEDGLPIPWVAPELNATDPDDDTLTWSLLASPVNGSATVSGSGESPSTFNFTPAEDFNGTDSFVVRVSDGSVSIDVTVDVTVESVNEAPVIAQGDSVSVTMSEDGSPSTWTAPVIIATDTDAADDELTWSVLTAPSNGTAIVSGTGTSPTVFDYEPSANFFGGDSFVVQASDGNATDSITVNVTLLPINDAPVLDQNSTLAVTMSEDEAPIPWVSPTLTASDADGDNLVWNLSALPANGTASVSGTGSTPDDFSFLPNPGFVGADSFSLEVSDGNSSVLVTVAVNVVPTNLPPRLIRGVSLISVGTGFSLYLDSNGSLYGSGANENGQLGDGSTIDRVSFIHVDEGVIHVAAGGGHSLYVKDDGSLWAMGGNAKGQLGDGSTTNRTTPVQILSSDVVSASTGKNHSLFVKADGSLWGMGENISGQLGDGSTTDRHNPVRVVESNVTSVSAGTNHSLFVKTDGSLWAIGSNAKGAFGLGSSTDSVVPVQVLASGVSSASAGGNFSLIVTTSGALLSSGGNTYGQLGTGDTMDSSVTFQVLTSGASSASAGLSGTAMFVKTNGSLWAMGNNQYGQLGDGSATHRSTPVQIETADVLLAAAGATHALYAKYDGSLRGVGGNDKGALGDGSTNDYSISTEILDGHLTVTMSEDGSPIAWSFPQLIASDSESDVLTWSVAAEPSHGKATFSGTGTSPSLFLYEPDGNYTGVDSFVAQVSDGMSATSVTFDVTVTPEPDAPAILQGSSVSVTMSEDAAPIAWVPPAISGFDVEGDPMTWSLFSSPANGDASVNGSGSTPTVLQYNPNADFAGTDSFVIEVTSAGNLTDTITVDVTVEGVNDAPLLSAQFGLSVTMSEDGFPNSWSPPSLSVADPDSGDVLTWSVSSPPSNGSATVAGAGSNPSTFLYAPSANHYGSDSFTVQVTDGSLMDEIAVNVTIIAVGDAPAIDQGDFLVVTMSEDGLPVSWNPTVSVTDPDLEDILTWSLFSPPSTGIATVGGFGSIPSTFDYSPSLNWSGSDSFVLTVDDGATTDSITVTVTVESINDPPVISPSSSVSVTMSEESSPLTWTAPILSATDVEGDGLVWALSKQASNGVALVTGTGSSPDKVTYEPSPNFAGTDSFDVEVSDGNTSSTITVNVTVENVNDPPVILQGDSASVVMSEDGSPTAWSLSSLTVSDPDVADAITWSVVTKPLHGTVELKGTGASAVGLSYAPEPNWSGSDSFVIQVADGVTTDYIIVNVTVELVNDLPTSLKFTQAGFLYENCPVGTIVGIFSPSDENTEGNLVYSLVADANGSVLQNNLFSLDANGSLKTSTSLDFEATPLPQVTVRVSNLSGEILDETFAVLLTDIFLPGVDTSAPTSILSSSAILRGAVEDSGDDPGGISERGFLLGRKPDPSFGDVNVTQVTVGLGNGGFSVAASSLVPGRVYYYRAYATNSEGSRYGPQRRFVTSENRTLGPLSDAVNITGNWWRSQWFGDFYTTDTDWLYHTHFGWLFVHGDDPSDLWFWQEELGWIWTSNLASPYLYSANIGNWMLWQKTDGDDAVFFDYSQANWVRFDLIAPPSASALYK